jgi:glucose-6-phosphate isomerase
MELAKPINVFMPYSSYLTGVADWYIQLVAESLGKSTEHGPTPIKAVGATDQHSQLQLFAEGPRDKVVFFLQVERFRHEIQLPQEPVSGWERLAGKSMRKLIGAELAGTSRALGESGVPNLVLEIPEINPEHLGDLLYTLEVMTALAGDLYRVNAFDQPGVELSKKYAYQELERS